MGAVIQLVKGLAAFVPFPVLVGGIVLAAVLGLPGFLKNIKSRQIRGAIRKVARATTRDTRKVAEDATMAIAATDPHLLLQVAEESLRLNQRGLCERAVKGLEETGELHLHARRLRGELSPKAESHDQAIDALVAVRRLLDGGLTAQGRARLAEARARFPDDADLRDLEGRLATAATEG